jgi:sporulation protein YlmC with PRC-barrel domain
VSILQPLQQGLSTFFNHAPRSIEAIAILAVGYVVARLLLPIVTRLFRRTGSECWTKDGKHKAVLRRRGYTPEVHQHPGRANVLASGFIASGGGGSPPAIAERPFNEGRDLIRVSNSDSALEDRAQDVCRRVVRDRDGQEIGTLEDLYVDTDGATARFLIVDASIALRLDQRRFLIPLEAVRGISAGWVTLTHYRDKIADSPNFEQKAEVDRRYQTAIYRYYGYFWAQADGAAEYAAS